MKRLMPRLGLLLAVCLLCACTQAAPATGAAPVQTQPPTPQTSLRLLHDPEPGSGKPGLANDGMYFLRSRQDGSGNVQLYYVDYETQSTLVVCNRPECTHDSEACGGWFPARYGWGITFAAGGKLYILFSGTNVEGQTPEFSKLLQMEGNGSGRRQLCEFLPSEQVHGAVATDDTFLYATVKVYDPKTGEVTTQLRRIHLQTGEAQTLHQWDKNVTLTDVAQGKLLCLEPLNYGATIGGIYVKRSGNKATLWSITPEGESEVLQTLTETEEIGGVRGGDYIQVDTVSGRVRTTNLFTGEQQTLGEIEEAISSRFYSFSPRFEDKVFFYVALTDLNESSDVTKATYVLDLKRGTVTKSGLKRGDENVHEGYSLVDVLAVWRDDYVVCNRIENLEVGSVDAQGATQTYVLATECYALMKQEDFINAVPEYRNIAAFL